MQLKYVITETGGPESFDPVNADKTQNFSTMRMLYATPLETDRNNRLKSYILKDFQYDEEISVAKFELRSDIYYADGTLMTIDDVALSILRMAHNRPDFPVIKHIKGIQDWAKNKHVLSELPSGLKINKNILTIYFSQKLTNPLFRFCLEIFSIIPKACINLGSGELNCKIPPASGYFEIDKITENELVFKKRENIKHSVDIIDFDKIFFQFKSLKEACSSEIEKNQVVSGMEVDFITSDCEALLAKSQVHWMPAARFLVLRFNPHVSIFKDKKNRQFFSEKIRHAMRTKYPELIIERGLFPRHLPGYVDSDKLEIVNEDRSNLFKEIKINFPQVSSFGKIIFDANIEVAKSLGMDVKVYVPPSMEKFVDSFISGEFPVVVGSSGFWAQDPVGDVSMWFTKNLHKSMTFLWEDELLYKKIELLEIENNSVETRSKMENFNRYIFDESVIAPILHFRRLFISSRSVKGLSLPQSITSPAPWQITVVEK